MGGDDPARQTSRLQSKDRRYDGDIQQHVGLIIYFVRRWQQTNGLFREADTDELVSIAYIEAADLLEKKYDPRRSKVSTFLRRFLLGRVDYRFRTTVLGQKRWDNQFVNPEHDPRHNDAPHPEENASTK